MSSENESAGDAKATVYGQGFHLEGGHAEALARAIDAAFDYRGNVTLLLESGEDLCGYVSNRDSSAASPFLEIFPQDGAAARRVAYAEVKGIHFSGRDTASGRSWEAWLKRYEQKKAAEARGEPVGSIDMFPDDGED